MCAVAGMLALLTPAWASELEERKDEVEQQLEEAKSELHESTEDLAEATAAYEDAEARLPKAEEAAAAAEEKLSAAQSRLQDARSELTAARAEDARASKRLATAEKKVDKQQERINNVSAAIDDQRAQISNVAVRAYQRGTMGKLSEVSALLDSDNVDDFVHGLAYAQSVMQAEDTALSGFKEKRVELANERVKLEELREEARVLRAEAADALERSTKAEAKAADAAEEAAAQESKAREAKQTVEELVDQRSAALAAAEEAKEADEAAYADLKAEREKIDEEIAEMARAQAARETTARGSERESSGGSSSSLIYPVDNASITSPYGMRTHPITGVHKLHDGTDFSTGCGTPIKAAASGTVQWAEYRGGYGNQVLVDHGSVGGTPLMTSYSHLSQFAVSPGATVSQGQVIAYAGTTGYSTGCHLHFMVYANGTRTNPMNYL
ncbi:MAG: peptidoglycan DD-metalloendopeptidase family protein [Actinomycetota bacterium]